VSFQRFTGGRFAWQVKVGGTPEQRRALGDFASEEQLLRRIEEFVTVSRGVITQTPYSFKGEHFEVLNGGFRGPLGNQKVPPVYLSGSAPEHLALSAKVADVHVFDAAPLDNIREGIANLAALAATHGRNPAYGLRIDIVARETEKEAIFDARRYWEQSGNRRGQGDPLIRQYLWSGLSTDGTGAQATLVGNYDHVAEALVAYAQAGISHFLLSAVPHFEEAYRIGEFVLPRVRSQLKTGQQRAA
jgi:alkanesulfonate monooxygenase